MYRKLQRLHWIDVDEVLSVTGTVGFYGARFTGGKESICGEAVRNVGASSAVSATTEGSWGLAELEESLAVTSKSRRLGERLKATTGKCWKTFLQRFEESNKL